MDAFESLDVWKRSSRLCVDLYKLLHGCKDRGFRDQITRASLSVPSNIAEGYERGSRAEFQRFLNIAKGSCGELRAQLYIGMEAGLVDRSAGKDLLGRAFEISKMLQGLVSRLSTQCPH